jgi:hypothetical protein
MDQALRAAIIAARSPGGKDRMRRLMEAITVGRLDTGPPVTHGFKLDHIEAAYDPSPTRAMAS